ncbi:hypothetical protein B2J88_49930 [Rhodococcus sp. SRB_17]|nr:hypothetical protein [Rhodococcus sp. SRB_17]
MRTYRDYDWLRPTYDGWIGTGYGVTLIDAISPGEVLDALGAPTAERLVATGLEDINREGLDLDTGDVDFQVVAVADAGDGWTLMLQQNSGYLGITEAVMRPLFERHQVLSHNSSINGDGHFMWWSHGELLADFEPLNPGFTSSGAGTAPEEVIDLIRQIGGIELDDTPDGRTEYRQVEGAFALGEQLTGVTITPELLGDTEFTVSVVPLRPGAHRLPPVKPSDVESLMQTPPSWSEMMRLHKASAALTLHGEMTKTTPSQNQVRAVEFWFKPKRSWRLVDGDGVVFLQNRRQKIWHRKNGVLQQRTGGFTLALDPGELIEMALYWYGDLDSLVPADVRGVEVVVAGRLAWEFHPPGRTIIETAVAFDAETGIAVRRSTKSWTTELVSFEAGIKLGDALFEGP